MAFKPGYHERVCAKVDIALPGHNKVLTRRQQSDLKGRRGGLDGAGIPTGDPYAMQDARQAAAAY
jgi:hypothetical protein